jgi:hypothetical protein
VPHARPPGRPSANDAAALEVMEQLEQNAGRLRLLSDQYPFEIDTQRSFLLRRDEAPDSLERIDTVLDSSAARTPHRPGRVVVDVRDGSRRETIRQVPTLLPGRSTP